MEKHDGQLLMELDPVVRGARQLHAMRPYVVFKQPINTLREEARVAIALDGIDESLHLIVRQVVNDNLLVGHLSEFSGCRTLRELLAIFLFELFLNLRLIPRHLTLARHLHDPVLFLLALQLICEEILVQLTHPELCLDYLSSTLGGGYRSVL